MDILHLRYFSRVYETLNYSKSANELFISRQALRQVIRNLENEVGYQLFNSFSNKLKATVGGDLLYQSSRDTLRAFDNLQSDVKNLHAQLNNDIRYGLMPCIHDIYDTDDLEHCRRMYPDSSAEFRITYISESISCLRQMVRDGMLDCATFCSARNDEDDFDCLIRLEPKPIYLLVNCEHPLSKLESVCIDDLKGQHFATQGRGFDAHDLIMQQCRAKGFEPQVIYTSQSSHDLLNIIRTGKAFSYSYIKNVQHYHAPDAVCIRFREPVMQWRLVTISQKNLAYNAPIKLYMRRIKSWW